MNIEKLLKIFLVPLAFVACSENGDLSPSAPSGESNVLLSSSDGAIASSSSEQFDGSEKVYRGIKVYAETFSGNQFLGHVCIYELDPVTFDTTRFVPFSRTFYKTSYGMDSIVIDSLSLRSPYIMLTTTVGYSTDPFEARLYNVVDVRETDAFAFDKKTYLESIRTLYLVRSGKSFAEAKKQASKEVLEAFGSFANAFDKSEAENIQNADYRNYLTFIVDFLEFTTEDTVAAKFEKCGDMTCGTEFLKIRFLTESVDMLREYEGLLEADIDEAEVYKLKRALKARSNLTFLKPFVAQLLGAGACSSEKEGAVFEVLNKEDWLNKNILLTCHSGKWDFSYKKMKYTMGTMTDDRDGKTYKTVTYDINGKTQTWMAERLDYAAPGLQISCENRDDNYGCGMYYVYSAFGLDSSIVESKESCVQRYLKDFPESESSDFDFECDNLYERVDTLKYHQHIISVMAEKGVYQGVCPNGWHIPARGELNTLLDHMVEWYNLTLSKNDEDYDGRRERVWRFLYSSSWGGNPSGFELNGDFYVIDDENRACSSVDRYLCYDEDRPFEDENYVRCIKN